MFNYIEKLRLDDSLNDDLEDINNLIDTEVGVENLQQNQYEDPNLMASFQHQQETSSKVKVVLQFYCILTQDVTISKTF